MSGPVAALDIERERRSGRTLAAIGATIVDAGLEPARRRRRRMLATLVAGVLVAVALTAYAGASGRPALMSFGAALGVVAAAWTHWNIVGWSALRVDGAGCFYGLANSSTAELDRTETLSEPLLAELRRWSGPSGGSGRLTRVPHPTSRAVDANLDRLAALDLYHLPARNLTAGQLAELGRRWLSRVVPGCEQAAEVLSRTGHYQDLSLGEVASAAARSVRLPAPTPPLETADWFGAPPRPVGESRPTTDGVRAACAAGVVTLLAAGLAGFAVSTIVDGFGERTYTTLTGEVDLDGASPIGTWLATSSATHRFLLDEDGRIVLVDDDGRVVQAGEDNRPEDPTATATMVAVTVDHAAIPARSATVYRRDDGAWTTDRADGAYHQDRPGYRSMVASLTLLAVAFVLTCVTPLIPRRMRKDDARRQANFARRSAAGRGGFARDEYLRP